MCNRDIYDEKYRSELLTYIVCTGRYYLFFRRALWSQMGINEIYSNIFSTIWKRICSTYSCIVGLGFRFSTHL